MDQFWIIDYRIYDPDGDGKTKLVHVQEMLSLLVYHKQLPFETVLMDSWYATKDLMLHIEKMEKRYYCPLKSNRLVDDSNGLKRYQRIDALMWNETELQKGKLIKIKRFPKDHRVKLFRVASSTRRTEKTTAKPTSFYVATNDIAENSTSVAQEACDWRWKIEP